MKLHYLILVAVATIAVVSSQQIKFNLTLLRACSVIRQARTCEQPNDESDRIELVKSLLRCNNTELAREHAYDCTRSSESGAYCGTAPDYFGQVVNLLYNTSYCAGVAYGVGACTPLCKAGLTALRNKLGCCLNTYFNRTGSSAETTVGTLFNTVWTACGVDPINEACPPDIAVDSLRIVIPAAETCGYARDITITLDRVCTTEYYDKLKSDFLETGTRCDIYLDYFRQLCSLDANRNYCLATKNDSSDYDEYIIPLQSCQADFQNMKCLDSCKKLLQSYVTNRGCCVNSLYNSTFSKLLGGDQSFIPQPAAFRLCGVTPPSVECPVPFELL